MKLYDEGVAACKRGDYTTAFEAFSAAAEQGDARSHQYRLGVMYEYGKGVPQDYAAAMNWYRKAAEKGDAAAQYLRTAMAFREYESYYVVIRAIPPGRVMTYRGIAVYTGYPPGRAHCVGRALAALKAGGLPKAGDLPWWRVTNVYGEIISPPRMDDGSESRQRVLLESEGVEFTLEGRVNLDRFLHRPD